ncbi:MAG: hypothetical protein ACRD3J_23845, partial [Thermoanaerobaculia bacterium]
VSYSRISTALTAAIRRNLPTQTRGRDSMEEQSCALEEKWCVLWQVLLRNPEDAAAVEVARSSLDELLEHVDECDRCGDASEHAERAMAVFETLGLNAEELPPPEDAALDEMFRARSDDEDAVKRAVEDALVPGLPPPLRDAIQGYDSRTVFLATEAVSMLVHRYARFEVPNVEQAYMERGGSITFDRDHLIPSRTVHREIARRTKLTEDEGRFFAAWMVDAARTQPRLFLGLDTVPRGADEIVLWVSSRDTQQDLYERWRPTRADADWHPSRATSHQQEEMMRFAASYRNVAALTRRS